MGNLSGGKFLFSRKNILYNSMRALSERNFCLQRERRRYCMFFGAYQWRRKGIEHFEKERGKKSKSISPT